MSNEATLTPEPGQATVEVQTPEIEAETEDERVLRWRLDRFNRLGFDSETAVRLAASKADWHEVESWLERGCELRQAERLAL